MGRGFVWRAGWMTLCLAACATGATVGFEDDDDDDDDDGQGGGATSCAQPVQCVHLADDCNEGQCIDSICVQVATNEGGDCEDDDPCTATGTCASGSCQPGGPTDCSHLEEGCGVGVCDPQQGCVVQPGNAGGSCDDGLFCTENDVCDSAGSCAGPDAYDCGPPSTACAAIACDEDLDACSETPITTCTSGDGCCPASCSAAQDSDCTCSTNHALSATPSSSGGGTGPCCALSEMNNTVTEPICDFHWIGNDSSPSGAYIQYQWAAPVTIGSTYIATQQASSTMCGSSGRNVNSGSVQTWDGSGWVTATTFSSQLDDVAVDLPQPITTTRLRIYDMTTSPGNGNSIIYEWYVFPTAGCLP